MALTLTWVSVSRTDDSGKSEFCEALAEFAELDQTIGPLQENGYIPHMGAGELDIWSVALIRLAFLSTRSDIFYTSKISDLTSSAYDLGSSQAGETDEEVRDRVLTFVESSTSLCGGELLFSFGGMLAAHADWETEGAKGFRQASDG